jgi:hypothetical protein
MNHRRATVSVLAACAASDLAAVPLLLGDTDIPAAVGALVALLGLLTVVAAIGVARHTAWARRLALSTRVVDLVTALTPRLSVQS